MPHRYDASTKYLLDVRLADWLPLSGRTTTARLRIVDADVSTVTAAADRVLVVEKGPVDPARRVAVRTGCASPRSHAMYNTVIGWRHALAVRSLVVLLRPAADGAELTCAKWVEFRQIDDSALVRKCSGNLSSDLRSKGPVPLEIPPACPADR